VIKTIFTLLFLIVFSNTFSQKLTLQDLVIILESKPGKAQEYLSTKGFVYKNEMQDSESACPSSRWVSLKSNMRESVTKKYCYDGGTENSFIQYGFSDIVFFNQFIVNLKKIGYGRVDTFTNVDGMNVRYQKRSADKEIIVSSLSLDTNIGSKFSIRIFYKTLEIPFEDNSDF
jgi:hypothetical protein